MSVRLIGTLVFCVLVGAIVACSNSSLSTSELISSPTPQPSSTPTHQTLQPIEISINAITATPYYPGLISFPKIRVEYYDIEGTTREELLEEIRSKGPIAGLDREHSTAAVEYDILYTWPGRGMAGCEVSKGEIWYSVKVYAPRWAPPPNTPGELIDAWIFFMEQVKSHEEDHIELVRQYFGNMLQDIASAQSCAEAWNIAYKYEQDLYRAQLKYDRDAEPSVFPEY